MRVFWPGGIRQVPVVKDGEIKIGNIMKVISPATTA